MIKKKPHGQTARSGEGSPGAEAGSRKDKQERKGSAKKMSEFGKQLHEKQKVKRMYGMREKQFALFFNRGTRMQGAPGDNLLSLLERRLDNTLYRLKMAVSRTQARQMVVHRHVWVNGHCVHTPSYIVRTGDEIALAPRSLESKKFLEQVVDKRLNIGIKVPEWLELDKGERRGKVLRTPVRSDIQVPIEEHLIVELYSR